MKTLFCKLIASPLFFIGAFIASSASATSYTVTNYVVYANSAGGNDGYLTTSVGSANCCIFMLNNVGPGMTMALATAKQMKTAVVKFYGAGSSTEFVDSNSGASILGIEFSKDPALLPAGISEGTPFYIYANPYMVEFYTTCVYGTCQRTSTFPGYTGGWRFKQLLTGDTWYNLYGYSMPVAALTALYNAFAGQYGVMINTVGVKVDSIYLNDCITLPSTCTR